MSCRVSSERTALRTQRDYHISSVCTVNVLSLLKTKKSKPAGGLQLISAQCSSNQVMIQMLYIAVPYRLTSWMTCSTVFYNRVILRSYTNVVLPVTTDVQSQCMILVTLFSVI